MTEEGEELLVSQWICFKLLFFGVFFSPSANCKSVVCGKRFKRLLSDRFLVVNGDVIRRQLS